MSQGPTLVHDVAKMQTNELARRLAAAFVSVWAGYSGVDYLLKQTPETADGFWYWVAEFVEKAFQERQRLLATKKRFKCPES